MPKEIPLLDLLSKLSANSFLIDTRNESIVITPGVFFGLPGKFFEYIDVVDTALKVMKTDDKGNGTVNMEEFKNAIANKALDLNQYFTSLEKEIPNKDVLGLNKSEESKPSNENQQTQPSNNETPQTQPSNKESTQQTQTKPKKAYYGKKTYNYGKKTYNGYTKKTYKKGIKKSGTK